MQQILIIIHVLVAICLIVLVLIQHGKGADMGASFGSGASQTMFGSSGSLPFLIKITAVFATIFFLTSLTLSYLASPHVRQNTGLVPMTPATTTTVPVNTENQPTSSVPNR